MRNTERCLERWAMARIEDIRKGDIPQEVYEVAKDEGVSVEWLANRISEGRVVILLNSKRNKKIKPVGIGYGLRTKVNVNIGTSPDRVNYELEMEKLNVAEKYGADTVMDLSIGGNVKRMLEMVIERSSLPVGTVPIYQSAVLAKNRGVSVLDLSVKELFDVIVEQAEMGVDFITVHCGITKSSIERIGGRLMGVVSRGGSMMIEWMGYNKRENPFYEYYDELLDIAYEYDITLSLGDGLRPGAIEDATDLAQISELQKIGELVERARQKGVQSIVEGPGHIPLNEIEINVKLEKSICKGAPFYVLGPLVTDIAPGYDHITSAIGGALASMYGADFLCYVTPSEHLRLPSVEDVKEGLIASKIAAHAGDVAKGLKGAKEQDLRISELRKKLDWEGLFMFAIDPDKAKRMREGSSSIDACTMCGEFCPIKVVKKS